MKAEYVDHMGTDLTVVNAARVSFDKQHEYFDMADERLVKYLGRNGHWTPFGHPTITIRETVPIWIARQRMRSNVGFVYNEVSRRYVDDTPEFYTPKWYARVPNLKQGSAEHEVEDASYCTTEFAYAIAVCWRIYEELLKEGVAPEQARAVLPLATYTSYYVTGSLAAWARVYLLRIDPHASKEMQEMARQWSQIIEPLFPFSWRALIDNKKEADKTAPVYR